jgi:glycosyltransferase involved in cell wall biosynthesis
MKICILIDRLNVGGVEKIAIEQVKALRAIHIDASLVVLTRKAVVPNAFEDLRKGLPTIFLDDRLPGFLKFSFKFPIFSFFSLFHLTYPFFIPFVIKGNEFDYVIAHGTYTSFTAVGIKKIKKIPFSSFIWDPISYILTRVYITNFPKFILLILKKIAGVLDNLIISNSDVILVGGKAHNNFFELIAPQKNIVVIPPSTNPIYKLNQRKEKHVLMVTAWKKGKNPEYLEKICRELSSIKIKMVGKWLDSEYLNGFNRFLEEKNLERNIEIIGEVSEKDLSNLYKKAYVLLQTNDDKGFGMPALEAAAHGTTFIIPSGQGVCELFTQSQEGFFTKENDTTTIVKYLKTLLASENKALVMGEKAWKKVKKNYSWEKHAKMLEQVVLRYAK